jgi:hypothetical protein
MELPSPESKGLSNILWKTYEKKENFKTCSGKTKILIYLVLISSRSFMASS